MNCPLCGKINNDNWPINVYGQIKYGGCQECWEKQADQVWWDTVRTIDNIERIE